MAVTRTQAATATQASGVSNAATISFAAAPAVGALILLCGSARSGGMDVFSVTDAGWNEVFRKTAAASGELIMYGKISAGAADQTVHVAMDNPANTPAFALQVLEYDGLVSSSWADVFDNAKATAGSSGFTGVCDLPDSDDELWVATFYAQTNGGLITDAGSHLTSVALATTGAIVANRVYEGIPGSSGDRLPADSDVQMGSGNLTASGIAMFRQAAAGAQPDTGTGSVAGITRDHTNVSGGAAGPANALFANAEGALLVELISTARSGGVPVTVTGPGGWSHLPQITNPDGDALDVFYLEGAPANYGAASFTFSVATAFASIAVDYSGIVPAAALLASDDHMHQGGVGGGVSPGGTTCYAGMAGPVDAAHLALFLAAFHASRVSGGVSAPTNGYTVDQSQASNGQYVALVTRTSEAGGFAQVNVQVDDPGVGAGIAQLGGIIMAFDGGTSFVPTRRRGGLDSVYDDMGGGYG